MDDNTELVNTLVGVIKDADTDDNLVYFVIVGTLGNKEIKQGSCTMAGNLPPDSTLGMINYYISKSAPEILERNIAARKKDNS